MTRVLAVDPGYGTGWASYDTYSGQFRSGECWTFADCAEQLYFLLAGNGMDEVVAENFVITARTARLTQQTEALRLLGVTEWLCQHNRIPFTLQSPKSPNKPHAQQILKALKWHVKTKDDHANSAAWHLYTYLASRGMLHDNDKLRLINMMND